MLLKLRQLRAAASSCRVSGDVRRSPPESGRAGLHHRTVGVPRVAIYIEFEPDEGVAQVVPQSPLRSYRRAQAPEHLILHLDQPERAEGVGAIRGLAFGIAFSAPLFALVIWGVGVLSARIG
ncbi:UNVERIFIED_CONTAM: hypothetical protein OHV15_09795 [Microbacterium sp. SLM126]